VVGACPELSFVGNHDCDGRSIDRVRHGNIRRIHSV